MELIYITPKGDSREFHNKFAEYWVTDNYEKLGNRLSHITSCANKVIRDLRLPVETLADGETEIVFITDILDITNF